MMTISDAGTDVPKKLLRRKAAAKYLNETWGIPVAPQTLAKLALTGGGPGYRIFSRFPLYAPADLDSWAVSKLGPKQRSTSDKAGATR